MHPIVIKHFSEISAAEYHRIVQAREAVFFLEQHITDCLLYTSDAADEL